MRLIIVIATALAVLLTGAVAQAAPGQREERTYPNGYRAVVYTPASIDRTEPAPLFVMVHGCNTTAEQQEVANELDEQAERDRFVVLYADHEGDPVLHPARCWRYPTDTTRDSGDPSAIAAMVLDALARPSPRIDRSRVYYAGMSSGAMIGSVVAATYPDLFAAFMLNAGCAYRAMTCIGAPPSRPSATLAQEAVAAMGDRKRVVPVLVSHGDRDTVVPPAHAPQVVDQWRMTNNLVTSGGADGPIAATPTTTRQVTRPNGYASTVTTFADRSGCPVLERWQIHGMDHYWPGGSSDSGSAAFTDPRGPDGGEVAWDFFKRFRLVPGSTEPCAPAAAPAKPAASCRTSRSLQISVPRGATRLAVRVNGRRHRFVRRGRIVRLRFGGSKARVVRVRVSGRSGRRTFVRRATVRLCRATS